MHSLNDFLAVFMPVSISCHIVRFLTHSLSSKAKEIIFNVSEAFEKDNNTIIHYRPVVLLWFSVACCWCQSFGVRLFILFLVRFGLLNGHFFGNTCSCSLG